MKVKFKKKTLSNGFLNGGRSVRSAGGPKRLSVRFAGADSKARDVVILMRASGANLVSDLPERIRHFAASSVGAL
jgi:hypothetical protein